MDEQIIFFTSLNKCCKNNRMPRTAMKIEEVEAVRSELLAVAENLYEEGGPEAMSFRAIAQRYGCSNTMPYSYFGSKADIVDALRIRAYQWLQGVLEKAAAPATDPLEALRSLAAAYVEAACARPRIYELLYSQDGAKEETDPELVEAKWGALGVCQRVIEDAAASSAIRLRVDTVTTAQLFWASAHGLVSLHTGGFLVLGHSVDDLLPALFSTLTIGMFDQEVS